MSEDPIRRDIEDLHRKGLLVKVRGGALKRVLTQAHKTLVRSFVDDILLNGRMEKLAGYFDGDNYIQHNPLILAQISGLGKAIGEMAKAGITMKYDTIHKVLGEGNFVLSEGHLGRKHSSFYDLFRVKNGK